MVSRITPTAGKELTILEQIMGNVGRFSGPRAARATRARRPAAAAIQSGLPRHGLHARWHKAQHQT